MIVLRSVFCLNISRIFNHIITKEMCNLWDDEKFFKKDVDKWQKVW